MAKKIVPQEQCMFCGKFPCVCDLKPTSKLLREKHGTDRPDMENDEDGQT